MNIKPFNLIAIFCFCSVIIVALTFIFNLEGAIIHSDFSAKLWFNITNTGGVYGITIIILVFSILCGILQRNFVKKSPFIIYLILFLSISIGISSYFNEHYIKESIKVHRPNICILEKEYGLNAQQFYQLESKTERRKYLTSFFNCKHISSLVINDKPTSNIIMKVWLHETGFSFPSGHSTSAFLLTTIIGYLFLSLFKRWKIFFIICIFTWATLIAYSRVLLGVHTPLDVTTGALWGCILGLALAKGSNNIFSYFIKRTPTN